MIKYTEEQMGTAFHYYLKHGRPTRIPRNSNIYCEFAALQGIADFILVKGNPFNACSLYQLKGLRADSSIFSLLKPKAGRKRTYVFQRSGLSDKSCTMALSELQKAGIIRISEGKFHQTSIIDNRSASIWAFELKLADWKRAIFQCLQYQSYANYSVAVFPMDKQFILINNLHYFENLNIGVLLFDPLELKSKWLFYPKRESSKMNSSRAYVLLKLYNLNLPRS